jgi:hypothetical protein
MGFASLFSSYIDINGIRVETSADFHVAGQVAIRFAIRFDGLSPFYRVFHWLL